MPKLNITGLEQHPQVERIIEILRRHVAARSDVQVTRTNIDATSDDIRLTLEIDPQLGGESFRISPLENEIHLIGGDFPGVLYGVGKFLRSCRFTSESIIPNSQKIESHPEKPLRGMYFATHFHNYYHDAPIKEINHYVEDLALWGVNTIQVWFDMHHYTGINDPAAQEMIARLRAILGCVKSLGLRTCLVHLGNEAYADSPPELRADFNTNRASYNVELCPNKPGAMKLMLQWYEEMLLAFADISPDFITFGPYDQGGCACELCKPWGANGYLKIAQAKAELTQKYFPETKIILSTWLFDHRKDQGEWKGLDEAFSKDHSWCDYIQADSHETYPEYPLKHGVPGGLPLLNFSEISMWRMHPWGGFGANPLPRRFEGLFNTIKSRISGGFPYSEGIYEDINKVLSLQFNWDSQRGADDILREYIAYEYSPDVVEDVLSVIDTLEKNHNHLWIMNWEFGRQARLSIEYKADPHHAFRLMQEAQQKLSDNARKSWRWRILYLRALLDSELHCTQGFWGNDVCEKAFEELTEIFHAENAEYKCAPPTARSVQTAKSSERGVTE
jgi:hypothetical protein